MLQSDSNIETNKEHLHFHVNIVCYKAHREERTSIEKHKQNGTKTAIFFKKEQFIFKLNLSHLLTSLLRYY